jgi:hypothetical protein
MPVPIRAAPALMKKPSLKKFLVEFGRYFEPAELFYHLRIAENLSRLGFQVLSIERLPSASRWRLRLKATLEAQAQLVGQTFRSRNLSYGKATKLLDGWLRMELRSILSQLGNRVKVGPIAVARHGAYFQLRFAWPLGTPGKWRPQSGHHPFRASGMIREWLKRQRN